MKRLGTKHTNILPLRQSNAISSPKEPFYKKRVAQQRHQQRWSTCSDYTQVHFFGVKVFFFFLFACLGCERRTLAALKFLPEKRRSKTNRAVCIQVEAEPQNHSLACGSQHTVPALTSPKTNTLKTRPPQPEREDSERKV